MGGRIEVGDARSFGRTLGVKLQDIFYFLGVFLSLFFVFLGGVRDE